ncbi:hypothetical protein Hanom_Chr02g00177751 [Helianthus anomalus]
MKNLIPVLRVSYCRDPLPAIRLNIFQTTLSAYSKTASKNILKCIIFLVVSFVVSCRSAFFKTASESVKLDTISALNFARCIDLISCIDSNSVYWSHIQY